MAVLLSSCHESSSDITARWRVLETNRAGLRLAEPIPAKAIDRNAKAIDITINLADRRQTIAGIGGALTESSGYALGQLSAGKRTEVLERYFGPDGAAYSLARVSIASCDFSTESYTYAPIPGDIELKQFSIERDRRWVLPLIKDAQAVSADGFRIMASPWSAPPWMKDNGAFFGGRLEPEHYDTFARYLARYLEAYRAEGIDIWSITPMNEPQGNGSQWESVEFTPQSMATFIGEHLGPVLADAGLDPEIFIFDQNRESAMEWAEVILANREARRFVDGIAVHWYSSTVDPYPEVLDQLRSAFPGFPVIHSEGCIDALGNDEPSGVWLEDDWYWRAEATDWGFYWAPDELKSDHPKYRPFYRYVRDLIVGLNHGMIGWIDWNIVLDFQGGPNHAKNFCGAPVLVDAATDTVYYTPLYYAMSHFSRFIRPGAVVVDSQPSDDRLLTVAAVAPNGTLAVVVFNPTESELRYRLQIGGESTEFVIGPQGLQTLVRPRAY